MNQESRIKNQELRIAESVHFRSLLHGSCFMIPGRQRGITLLLVIVLLSAILSISVGIFNVVFGELRISGEATDSFRALYAADQGIERTLYLDRQRGTICSLIQGIDCFVSVNVPVQSGGQYTVRVSKQGGITDIVVAGQNRAGANPGRVVKRGFQVTY